MMLPRPVISLLLLLCLAVGPSLSAHAPELVVTLPNGSPVHGQFMTSHDGHGIRGFTNIPYAEAPVGKLRFADPVPKAPWTGEWPVAKDQVIMCPQEEVFFYKGRYMGQEDCLYLNVYVPMNVKSKGPLPVMFFIHGGGFASGNGGQVLYAPDFLLDEDVILVAGNYRLGALGFLSTFSEEFPGNYGLKDQLLMMKWIQENIAAFGGDPHKVTIFGESAGAGSVGYHLLSPKSKGLFSGAILQSGSPYESWANVSQRQSLQFAEKMFDLMGCEYSEGDYKAALECLRTKDETEFVAQMKNFAVWGHHPVVVFAPVKEVGSKDPFITQKDYESPVNGNDVPIMLGVTANEGAFITAMIASEEKIIPDLERDFDDLISPITYMYDFFDKETLKQKAVELKQRYFSGQNFDWKTMKRNMTELNTDLIFLRGFERMITRRIGAPETTFVYKFNFRGSFSFTDMFMKDSDNLGVSHVDDLLYLFPMVKNVMKFRVMHEEDHKVRKQMVKMWTHFAIHRDPSTKNNKWTPVSQFPVDYMRIGNCNVDVCDETTKFLSGMESGLFESNLQFTKEFFGGAATAVKEEL